MNHTALLEDNE